MQDTTSPVEIATLKSNLYWYYPNTLNTSPSGTTVGIETTSEEYKTLFMNKAGNKVYYWLASSYVGAYTANASFGMSNVHSNGSVNRSSLYVSYGNVGNYGYGVRPVVSLKSDIELKYDAENEYYDIIK